MDEKTKQQGITTAVLERFQSEGLPRLMAIKDSLDQGGTISERDIDFLNEVLKRLVKDRYGVEQHPEWQSFYAQLVGFCSEIIARGVENETRLESAEKPADGAS